MRIEPIWYYSNYWECEYSLTWRLRTHELIKIITGICYVGTVGKLLQNKWLCSVHRQGLTQALTLLGSVLGRRRQWSLGQANLPGFQVGKSSSSTPHPGSEFSPRSGDMERTWGCMRLVLTGCSPGHHPNWDRAGAAGALREDFWGCCCAFRSENRAARTSPASISPGGAAPAATCCCAKQGFSLSKFSGFPVLLLYPTDKLGSMEKPGRAGWMCLSHTSWLALKNRGSCWRREIDNLGGFGTILPELRKENKACVGKLWHTSNLRCLEDHSSFLWIYPRNLKIDLVFFATCMFHFYLSALCLGTFFYYTLPLLAVSPQVCSFSVLKC